MKYSKDSLLEGRERAKRSGAGRMNVAILDDYQGVALKVADWSKVAASANIVVFTDHLGEDDAIVARLGSFEIVILMRERTRFTRTLLRRLPALRLLVSPGMHHIAVDLNAASELEIAVCGVPGNPNRSATVELTWGLILGLVRDIPNHDRSVRTGGWQLGVGTSIRGKRLGVVGLGLVGSEVARIGLAFGMEVVAWSQNLTESRCRDVGVKYLDKESLLSTSDVVTVHLTLSERTRGLIGASEIGRMKPTAYLVNTARGPIVDEEALITALKTRCIAGAAVDVYNTEPLPDFHRMRNLPNAITTPHIGFVSDVNYRHFYQGCADAVLAYLDGKQTNALNRINR